MPITEFSRVLDLCKMEYRDKKLTIRQAAKLLSVDHRTLHQRIRRNLLKSKKETADNGHVKKKFVSVRDIADMLIAEPLKKCSGKPAKRYTMEEIEELRNTGKVNGRTYDSYKMKAYRLGLNLKQIRATAAEC